MPQFRTTDALKVRSGPSSSADVSVVLQPGTILDGKDYAWREVQTSDGVTGWVADSYLVPVGTSRISGNPAKPSGLIFDPTFPAEKQLQDWTCSIRSCMWMLGSIGIKTTAEEMQDSMYPAYVSQELGLLDASGAGVVKYLKDYWAIDARNLSPSEYSHVCDVAGNYPAMIGGRNWGGPAKGHWSGVRGKNAVTGELLLANPASGPTYGQTTLQPSEFAEKGYFSMVYIPL